MARWLTQGEQESWRAWIEASLLLTDRLSRDIQAQHGLTFADYEILVWLSEAPERRLRMSELARRALSSRMPLIMRNPSLRGGCVWLWEGLWEAACGRSRASALPQEFSSVQPHSL